MFKIRSSGHCAGSRSCFCGPVMIGVKERMSGALPVLVLLFSLRLILSPFAPNPPCAPRPPPSERNRDLSQEKHLIWHPSHRRPQVMESPEHVAFYDVMSLHGPLLWHLISAILVQGRISIQTVCFHPDTNFPRFIGGIPKMSA